ncbi:3-hydroxyisobutyrate dehydrogenase [Paraburkholderia bannensis]|uniref:3-hydroxyisobutyrate dehydrogenase n=1 Tax=Paraburkholderia tropica TaxID=92647 RepID=A0AAQ1GD85_9BURK|nr:MULTISPECIES: 3-hydroxyisobutyrate dehydrogenase [Paraburkholderia]RQM50994.1 3-hydroxyisobutyrate dehydrogenase [Paraburkholderia bannensis]RQN40275.1 3-hydroxyisobutyrate dehydrogenase [Paraburkholderia tropica]SEJ32338.1 3-hydroxyisobutyrate dehydrogenase [Paraburkholderia tropica]
MISVGFIGIGNMGSPMVLNLLKAGHAVTVFDVNDAAYSQLMDAGVAVANSALEAAVGVDVVITMLPNDKIVGEMYLGEHGLIAHLDTRPLLIDCSTVSAEIARKVFQVALEKGFAFIDAPVSGGVMGARDGTLSFMVGGEKSVVEDASIILHAMGKRIFHAGQSGAGQIAKMCNNMLAAVLMAGTAEALALGSRNGVDPRALTEIINHSTGRNFMSEKWNPWPGVLSDAPSSHNYQGGFQVALMAKDLGLAMSNAQAHGATIPLGALVRNLLMLHQSQSEGAAKLDLSSIQLLFAPSLKAV